MRVNVNNTMAIVVDYQEKLLPAMYEREKLEKNSEILLKGLKLLNIPMVITQQYTKGLGMSASFVFEAAQTEEYFDKTAFSAMKDEAIVEKVSSFERKNVLVLGIEAHVCVLQTCLDLKEQGYQPILVTDCITSRKATDLELTLKRAVQEGVLLTSYESILFELLEKAGGETFKAISKLVK